MEIVKKYKDVITLYVDCTPLIEYLKDIGAITMASYWVLKYLKDYQDINKEFIDMIINQRNTHAVAHLLAFATENTPQVIQMIPELSTGERYSVHLGNGNFLKVINGTDYGMVMLTKIQVSILIKIIVNLQVRIIYKVTF